MRNGVTRYTSAGYLMVPALLICLSACRSTADGENATQPKPIASVAPGPSLPGVEDIKILVNGKPVANVTERIRERTSLASLLDGEASDQTKWLVLGISGKTGASMRVADAGKKFKRHEILFYTIKGGGVALGVFQPSTPSMSEAAKKRASQPGSFVPAVNHIEVWTQTPPPAPKPAFSTLTVTVNGRDDKLVVDQAALERLPKAVLKRAPSQTKRGKGAPSTTGGRSKASERRLSKHQGWHLRDVAGLRVRPRRIASVYLTAKGGGKLELSGEQLRDPKTLAMIRRNKRCKLGVDVILEDGKKSPGHRLRDVVSMTITVQNKK